jgi:hypothetical protein
MFGWLKNIFGGGTPKAESVNEIKVEETKVVEIKSKAPAKKKAPVKKTPAKKKEAPVAEAPAPVVDAGNVVVLAPKKKAGRPKKTA